MMRGRKNNRPTAARIEDMDLRSYLKARRVVLENHKTALTAWIADTERELDDYEKFERAIDG